MRSLRLFLLPVLICPVLASAGALDDLLKAVNNNETEVVVEFLQRGMDVNTVDVEGNTLLMLAVRKGNDPLVEFLINNRAGLLKKNKYGDSALMLAAVNGDINIVRKLVGAGVKADEHRSGPGWTALIYAAFGGHAEIVRFLLENDADVDAQAGNGMTALMAACRNGHLEVVRLLLEYEADVDLLNQNNASALDLALANKHEKIAELLRVAGEDEQKPSLNAN